jgi:hypothetical protein
MFGLPDVDTFKRPLELNCLEFRVQPSFDGGVLVPSLDGYRDIRYNLLLVVP